MGVEVRELYLSRLGMARLAVGAGVGVGRDGDTIGRLAVVSRGVWPGVCVRVRVRGQERLQVGGAGASVSKLR